METQNTKEPLDRVNTEEIQESPVKAGIRSGLILGAISIIILLLLYLVNASLMANMWVGFGLIGLSLVLVIVFGLNYRKQIGGFIKFKNAFIFSMVLLVISGLVSQTFNYVLFNFIDPELVEVVTDAAIENTESIMERFGAAQDDIDEALERTEEQMATQYTIGGVAKGYFYSLFFYLIIALIAGAIVKKSSPEESL